MMRQPATHSKTLFPVKQFQWVVGDSVFPLFDKSLILLVSQND
jgi:hypothetical protein